MRKQLLTISAVVILSILVAGCSREVRFENKNFNAESGTNSDSELSNGGMPSNPDEASESNLVYGRVGDKVRTDRLEISLNTAKFGKGQAYFEPDNGRYLVLNFTFTNTSSESVNISSLTSFELQGSDLYKYSTTLWAELQGYLDGDIGPGKSLRGEVAFDVPSLPKYEIRFREEMFGDFLVAFTVEPDKDFRK